MKQHRNKSKNQQTNDPATTRANPIGSGGAHVYADTTVIDRSPFQHRTCFDPAEMEELKMDIIRHGIHTDLIVRPHPTREGRLELVAGERRLRCALAISLKM